MNEDEIKKLILDTLYSYFRQNSLSKYKDKFERTEDMIFVSDILKWYFQFNSNVDFSSPAGYIVVGDAIDDYVKNAFGADDRKLILHYDNYKIIGDPDIVISKDDYYIIIEVKFSDSVKEYHLIQTLMYMYLLSKIENTKNIYGVVLCIRNNIEIKVMRLDDNKISFIEQILKEYIDYIRIRRGIKDVITEV